MENEYGIFLNPTGLSAPIQVGNTVMTPEVGGLVAVGADSYMDGMKSMGLGGQGNQGNGFMNFLGSNGFKTGVDGLKTVTGLYNAYNSNKMAKQQLRFSRNFANANLANQTQSYNTALADRARSRGVMEGQSQAQVDSYIAANRLQDRTV